MICENVFGSSELWSSDLLLLESVTWGWFLQ